MPKRAPSPDLPKTSNLMVFWQPFPMNGNYEQPEHCKELFVWVASALGSYEHVLAIHHKPSARSMVLVEIDLRKKPDTLLAEHRWNEVLKNPCPEDENRVSRVYYSIYRTARDAQKDGWKCVHLDSSWFDDQSNEEFMEWAIKEGPFVHPYPKTYWCKDLEEDSTNKRMARPLPRASVPPPVVAAPPVPGSLAYALAQANQAPAQPKSPRSKSKKAQHAADPDNWGPAIKNPYQSAGAAPTFSTAAKSTGGNSAWARGPPTSALSAKAGGSTPAWASSNGPAPATGTRAPAPSVWTKPSASIKTARSAGGPAAPPAFPPGVPAPPSLAKVNGKGKGKKGAGTVDALSQSVDTLAISPTVATPTQSTSWADMMDEEDDADFGPNMYQVADNAYNSQSDNEDEGPTFIPLDDDPGSDPEADFIAQFEHEVLGAPQTVPTSPSSQSVNPGSPVPEGFTGVGKGGRGRKKGSKGKSTTPSETDSNPTPLSIAAVGMTHSFKHENLGFTEDFSGTISRCPYHGTTCKKGICDWRKKDERTKERAAFDKKKREDKEARKKQRLQEEKEKLEKAKLKNGSGGSQSGSSENAQSDDDESDVSVDSGDGGPGGNGRGRGGWNRGRGRVRGNRGRGRGNPAQAVRS